MNNFFKRTLTGTVFVACVLASIILSKWLFASLFFVITIVAITELKRIVEKIYNEKFPNYLFLIGILVYLLITLVNYNILKFNYIYILLSLFPIILVIELFNKNETFLFNIICAVLSIFWIVLPFSLLSGFYLTQLNTNMYSYIFVLGYFVLIWSNDTGAYIVGSLIGKRRIMPEISPQKSWEGFIGGAIFSIIISYLFSINFPFINTFTWLLTAIIIAALGTSGDFFESLLKRKAKIKDSGKILPGHGGVLDRFDAVLLTSPIVYILINLL